MLKILSTMILISMNLYSQDIGQNKEELNWKEDTRTILKIISPLLAYQESANDSTIQIKNKKDKLIVASTKINKEYKNKKLILKVARFTDAKPAKKELTDYGIKKAKEIVNKFEKEKNNFDIEFVFSMGKDLKENYVLAAVVSSELKSCGKCMRETSRYELHYDIPIPGERDGGTYLEIDSGIYNNIEEDNFDYSEFKNRIKIKIIKFTDSKQKALSINKGGIFSLEGIIQNIGYDANETSQTIVFVLK